MAGVEFGKGCWVSDFESVSLDLSRMLNGRLWSILSFAGTKYYSFEAQRSFLVMKENVVLSFRIFVTFSGLMTVQTLL